MDRFSGLLVGAAQVLIWVREQRIRKVDVVLLFEGQLVFEGETVRTEVGRAGVRSFANPGRTIRIPVHDFANKATGINPQKCKGQLLLASPLRNFQMQ